MRKVTFSVASSLDALIAGRDETIDWILESDEAQQMVAESWKNVDAMLLGRKTYEFALRKAGPVIGRKFKTYVFSRTLESVADGAVLAHDAVAFVRNLKAQDGGDIFVMGGGALATALIEAGLVDEIGLNIHPLLLGQGIPAFPLMNRRVNLELIEGRVIPNGCILVRYRVR